MAGSDESQFEQVIMPHIDAAYNLARWLARDDHDAQDIVQEACLRAFRFFGKFRGGNSRSWLLTIVRNTAYTWLRQNRPQGIVSVSDEEWTEIPDASHSAGHGAIHLKADAGMLRTALEQLPTEFREALVLRELEGFSYKEIADLTDSPMGTVMSRIARGRKQLQEYLNRKEKNEL
jgi:RNA polymerase sigma factor (sigma-70 family)